MAKCEVSYLATLAVVVGLISVYNFDLGGVQTAGNRPQPKFTATLVSWINTQAEDIVGEMEAIARHNANTDSFSLVSYLRYIQLFEELSVISKDIKPKMEWIGKKVAAFKRVYKSAVEILLAHLDDLDASLGKIEAAEKKSKNAKPNKDWIRLYETINYIAKHVSLSQFLSESLDFLCIFPTYSN